jgi:hypothetical protein
MRGGLGAGGEGWRMGWCRVARKVERHVGLGKVVVCFV